MIQVGCRLSQVSQDVREPRGQRRSTGHGGRQPRRCVHHAAGATIRNSAVQCIPAVGGQAENGRFLIGLGVVLSHELPGQPRFFVAVGHVPGYDRRQAPQDPAGAGKNRRAESRHRAEPRRVALFDGGADLVDLSQIPRFQVFGVHDRRPYTTAGRLSAYRVVLWYVLPMNRYPSHVAVSLIGLVVLALALCSCAKSNRSGSTGPSPRVAPPGGGNVPTVAQPEPKGKPNLALPTLTAPVAVPAERVVHLVYTGAVDGEIDPCG